jgi:UrcA family protein
MTRFLTAAVVCVAAGATLPCATTPALAQISDTVPSVTVKYGDLNIGSRPGAQMLLKRIEAAANTACGGAPDIRQLNQLASFETCRRSAIARAVVGVGSPALTAVARGGNQASFAAR